MIRKLTHCQFCGEPTFSPLRVCGSHRDLLEDDLDALVVAALESLPMQAGEVAEAVETARETGA